MDYMNILYRIFHEDLHPLNTSKLATFYLHYLEEYSSEDVSETQAPHLLKYAYYEHLLAGVLSESKRALHEKAFYCIGIDTTLAQDIQNHQRFIISYQKTILEEYLVGKASTYVYQVSNEKSNTDIFKLIYQTLDAILLYIEDLYPTHIDLSLPISYQRKLWFFHHCNAQLATLRQKIKTMSLPDTLEHVLLIPFSQIDTLSALHGLSYLQHDYYKYYLEVLQEWTDAATQHHNGQLLPFFIRLNINSTHAFHALSNQITVALEKHNSITTKLSVLQEYKKNIKTVVVPDAIIYDPTLPSLKEQVLLWIKEEIRFLKQKENGSLQNETPPKTVFSISVSEIALLSKLLYESDLIKGSKHGLFEFIAQNVSTTNVKDISVHSLKNHYYSISNATKHTIQDRLHGMLTQLKKV